jgi:hypothetical protein
MEIKLTDEQISFLIRAVVNSYAEDIIDHKSNDITDFGTNREVLGILIANRHLRDVYSQARKDNSMKDSLGKKLFMGCGWCSIVDKNKLHRRLEFAVSQLGGIEQNGGMGTEFDENAQREMEEDIKGVIRDMLMAFDLKPEDLK